VQYGSFVGPNRVKVGEDEYTADHILIAVGGSPSFPDLPGVEHCISSDGFFALKTQPKKVSLSTPNQVFASSLAYQLMKCIVPLCVSVPT
jgi:hypothetical protein